MSEKIAVASRVYCAGRLMRRGQVTESLLDRGGISVTKERAKTMHRQVEVLGQKRGVSATTGPTLCEVSFLNGDIEIANCALMFKNAPDRIRPGSIGKESSATLFEDPSVRASLRCIIAGFSANPTLQEDLMQEGLIHLWEVERCKPGQTKSWYLQSCQFHVRHWLAAGRSLDSPKRAQADKRIALDENDSEAALPEYHTNGEVFEAVSFRDVVSTLAKHLKPRERIVLCGLAEGLSVGEIGSRFGISRPTVLKDRRKIAALTIKLDISRPFSPQKQNRRSGSQTETETNRTGPFHIWHCGSAAAHPSSEEPAVGIRANTDECSDKPKKRDRRLLQSRDMPATTQDRYQAAAFSLAEESPDAESVLATLPLTSGAERKTSGVSFIQIQ